MNTNRMLQIIIKLLTVVVRGLDYRALEMIDNAASFDHQDQPEKPDALCDHHTLRG